MCILGALVTATAGALFTMLASADDAGREAQADEELTGFAEALRAAPYVPCESVRAPGAPEYRAYDSAYTPATSGVTITIDRAHATYWDPARDTDHSVTTFVDATALRADTTSAAPNPACDTATPGADVWDSGVQSIPIRVTIGAEPPVTLTTTVVKRDPAASARP